MAIINSLAEFRIGNFNDVRVNGYSQLFALSSGIEGTIVSFALTGITCGYLNYADIRFLGLEVIASRNNDCILAYPCDLIFLKGIAFQDYLSNHARIFGSNFRQDTNYVYINKVDLPFLELALNNTAESLFIALLLRVLFYESNDLISAINVYNWGTSFLEDKEKFFVLKTLVLEINIPVRYKYIDVEVINANTLLSPTEL